MHQQALQNIVPSFQMHPSHSPGFVHVRHASFRQLTSLPLEPLAALASGPSPVGVYLLLLLRFPGPLPRASVRLGDVADRKSVVEGKRVDLGGRRIIKKKKQYTRRGMGVLAYPLFNFHYAWPAAISV